MINRNAARDAQPVTPSDTAGNTFDSLYVGGAGDVAVDTADGTTVTFSGVVAGTVLPIRVTRVWATGTTATLILGLV